jgi:hypothetical protein
MVSNQEKPVSEKMYKPMPYNGPNRMMPAINLATISFLLITGKLVYTKKHGLFTRASKYHYADNFLINAI